MRKTISCLATILILSACAPSEKAIQEAIAETQTAAASPTPDATSTLTPSPTPDVRVITMESKNFLLALDDLPTEGGYYLPGQSWLSPHLNSEIIQDMGADKGQKYINDTGRIEGWIVGYRRASSKFPGPKEIYSQAIRYQSAAGVQVYLAKYAQFDKFIAVNDTPQLGDASREFIYKTGATVDYDLEIGYRNYVVRFEGLGLESEVQPEFLRKLASILLDRLKAAPLGAP